MSDISYTWFPKDWTYSDKTFGLTLPQRGLYRELIDLAMVNDNKIEIKIEIWARKWNSSKEEIAEILGQLEDMDLIKVNQYISVPSCAKRIAFGKQARKNGAKGGRPVKKKEEETIKKVKADNSLEARKKRFANDLRPFATEFGKQLLTTFYNYWTEHGPRDKRMRFEKQASFDPKRRLQTWRKNEMEFKSKGKL